METLFQYEAHLAETFQDPMVIDIGNADDDTFDNARSYGVSDDPGDSNNSHADQVTTDAVTNDADAGLAEKTTARADVGSSEPRTKRSKGPPAAQWEIHRDLIKELYRDRELKLEDVQKIMKDQHGFDATIQMYKKRLKDWNVRKNYTQEQKLEVLSTMQHQASPMSFAINGKPLKRSRLRRPVRRNGMRMALAPNLRASTPAHIGPQLFSATSQPQQPLQAQDGRGRRGDSRLDLRSKTPLQRLQFQQSPETWKVEIILRHVKQYDDQELDLNIGLLENMLGPLCSSQNLLSTDKRWAFTLLNQACAAAPEVFKAQPFMLLEQMIAVFSQTGWRGYHEVKRLVMRHFAAIAKQTHGENHPIALILKISCTDQIVDSMLPKIGQLVADVTSTKLRNLSEEWLVHQGWVAQQCLGWGDLEAAQTIISRILVTTEQRFGRQHWLYMWAMSQTGINLYLQGRREEAEQHYLAVVGEFSEQASRHKVSLQARSYIGLACISAHKGEVSRCKRYAMQALDLRLQTSSDDPAADHALLDYLLTVKMILAEYGTSEEVEQLLVDYGYILEASKKWELRPEEALA
ncbi:hypothetical protein A1O3_04936 [Capronia epimyces CBS 606.96]|uniref:Clr5 domain-containing protein n=1 Tax=Capronia epimyces CBS 606.96 TaxID=1182542 RepID=W9YPT3_9EURO|nr:uncharacterized protein A1O3_04936 [Capronia epimyces CBS 606.96]EXJ84269.1 hypothetical protein A1O3_04936 [Capronia epimyces CBS 606.96]